MFFATLFALFAVPNYAQESTETIAMTFEECLQYAKENSITLKQAQLSVDNSLANEQSARGSFLPNINASVGQSINATPISTTDSKFSYSGSYGIDLSLTLYNGGKNRAALKQSKVETEMAEKSLAQQENSIEMAVAEVFIQMLYAMEQIDVAKKSLEISERSLEQGKAFLEVGSINLSEYAQLVSSKASSEYSVILAETTLSNLQVSLKQLLEISQDVRIEAITPTFADNLTTTPLSTVQDVYESALKLRPEIAYYELAITSAEYDLKSAKSSYCPTLSFSAGTGLNHSSSSSYTFTDQMRNNFTTSAGLNLSIPIFNGYQTKASVTRAQNVVNSTSLSLVDAQKDLYQTIETLRNNAANAQAQYMVSEYKLEAVEESLKLVTEQYNVGMKNIIELLSEQDSYLESAQEYLTNKYQFILNKALLEYYKTDLITL